MKTLTLRSLWIVALCLFVSSVRAAPADEAASHFKAVAAGDVEMIMSQYGDSALLQWVGGPLDGKYMGTMEIRGVWTKFAKANAPLTYKSSKVETSANPNGATVTANVMFQGKATIKVRYVLTYRGNKLVNEIWQIDPNLNMTGD